MLLIKTEKKKKQTICYPPLTRKVSFIEVYYWFWTVMAPNCDFFA